MSPLLLLLACGTEGPDGPRSIPVELPDDSGSTVVDDTGDTDPDIPEDTAADTALADADADGWRVEDGDCDDADPIAYPGAPELCDGRDQDCDGEAIGVGGCGDGIDFGAHPVLPGWVGSRDYGLVGIVGVSSGSEGEDLIFGQSYAWDSPSDGTVHGLAVFRDMPGGSALPYPDGAADVLYPTWPWAYVWPDFPFVDHDGDGRRDLVLASPATESTAGAIFLIDEPGDEPRMGSYDALSKAVWLAPSGDRDFASSVDAHSDLDGDGLAEIVALTSGYWSGQHRESSTVYILRGREGLSGVLDPLDEIVLSGEGTGIGWHGWTSGVHGLPDLDGDGGAELLLDGGAGGLALGSGRDLLEADGATLGAVFTEAANFVDVRPSEHYLSPGDWNGDGTDDLAWVETSREDCLYIASYAAPFGGDLLADTLQQICFGDAALNQLRGDVDLDGDGLLEPILTLAGYGVVSEGPGVAHFIVPTSWLDGGRVEVTDLGMRVVGDVERSGGLLAADLDDDGVPELISSRGDAPSLDYVSEGLIEVLPGFEIPFGDPSRW